MNVKRIQLLIACVFSSALHGQDTHTVVTEYTAIGKAYTVTYPFRKDEGEVRIITASTWKADLAKTHDTLLTIKRARENKVVVTADISGGIVSMYDQDDRRFIGHREHSIAALPWHPWRDGGGVRGGNRAKINLVFPGRYTVTVPHDADIEAELAYGVMHYVLSGVRNGREHRTLDGWVDEGMPRTKLSTPRRRIEIISEDNVSASTYAYPGLPARQALADRP